VRRALIQPTKRGEIFVLDRETGAAIKTVQELAVPQGGIAPGDRLSPTQPFSTGMPSFRGALLREADMWGMTPVKNQALGRKSPAAPTRPKKCTGVNEQLQSLPHKKASAAPALLAASAPSQRLV
jgi:hypothetical protein